MTQITIPVRKYMILHKALTQIEKDSFDPVATKLAREALHEVSIKRKPKKGGE